MSGTTHKLLNRSKLLDTYLYGPPPVSSMHLRIDLLHPFGIFIMSLRGKYHVTSKFRVAKDCLDAWQNILIVELDAFAFNVKLLGLEWRVPRQLVVNDAIQLVRCLI